MGTYQSESRYYLHIQLAGIEPPIWRQLVVPGAISLHTLHKMLQVAMGWENAHLYVFRLTINEKTFLYGLPDPDEEHTSRRIRDSRRTKLDATIWADWMQLTYEYDMGDSWLHQMTIERIEHLADEHLNEDGLWIRPRCLAGERACPPEDVGGRGGYTPCSLRHGTIQSTLSISTCGNGQEHIMILNSFLSSRSIRCWRFWNDGSS